MVALTNREYQERISVAEKAVADLVDPQLKQVAFAKILEQLLSQSAEDHPTAMPLTRHANRHPTSRLRSAVNGGPVGLIQTLVEEQFFQHGKSLREVQSELQNRGHRIPRTSLSGPLQSLCRRKLLRRIKESSSAVYAYSNW